VKGFSTTVKEGDPQTVSDPIREPWRIYGLAALLLIFLYVIAVPVDDILAHIQARQNKEFQFVDSTNLIVVRQYGDRLLCVDVDTSASTAKIGKQIKFIPLSKDRSTSLSTQEIDNLIQ